MKEAVKVSPANKVSSSSVSKDEINITLDKIFDSVAKAIKANERKITLDKVDQTLSALFDAINKAPKEGSKIKLPDFQKILSDGTSIN